MPELISVSVALSDLEYYSPGWDAGSLEDTSPAAAGTQLLLGGEKEVRLSGLLKYTEEQIMVTQPSIEPRTSRTRVRHSCHYTTAPPGKRNVKTYVFPILRPSK